MSAGPRRGALIGAGGIASQSHLPAFRSGEGVSERLRIVAALDRRRPPPELPGIPVLESWRDLLAFTPLEFVDICTPTASHRELALAALAEGRHVLCEKPVALTGAEARELAIAARSANRVLMPCHQYRANPAWRTLRRWLDEGAIGHWHLAEFHVYRREADRGAGGADQVPWRGQLDQSRGGVLLDHGTHLLYQITDVAGLPNAVQAHVSRLRHAAYDVEDTAHLLLDFGDRLALVLLTWAASERDNRVRFVGERGTIDWIGGTLRRTERGGRTETLDFTAELDKASYHRWYAALFRAFADAMERGDAEAGLGDIERVAVLLEASYGAAVDGCRVRIDRI